MENLNKTQKNEIVEAIATITTPGRLHADHFVLEFGGNAWVESGKIHVFSRNLKKYFSAEFVNSHCTGAWDDDMDEWGAVPDEKPYLTINNGRNESKIALEWDNCLSIMGLLKEVFPNCPVDYGKTIIVKQGYKISY